MENPVNISTNAIPEKREFWPIAIILTFAFFISFILIIVFFMLRKPSELVSNDYYSKELSYQEDINKKQLTIEMNEIIHVGKDSLGKNLVFTFPEGTSSKATGMIRFLRPSDSKLDFGLTIVTNEAGLLSLPCDSLSAGLWNITMDWKDEGKSYLQEEYITL